MPVLQRPMPRFRLSQTVDQRYSALITSLSPLAWWRANGNGNDSSGNARHLTAAGTPTYAAGAITGSTDQAAVFNGSSQYFSIADAAWMDVTAITVSAWVKLAGWTGGWSSLVSRDDNASDRCWDLWIDGSTHKLTGVGWKTGGGLVLVTGSTALSLSTWYHVALRIQNSGNLQVFLGGSSNGSLPFADSLRSSARAIFVGRWNDLISSRDLNGMLDEVTIFPALSDANIAAIAAFG